MEAVEVAKQGAQSLYLSSLLRSCPSSFLILVCVVLSTTVEVSYLSLSVAVVHVDSITVLEGVVANVVIVVRVVMSTTVEVSYSLLVAVVHVIVCDSMNTVVIYVMYIVCGLTNVVVQTFASYSYY